MERFQLSGAPNARDLGGLVSVNGRRVRRGVLFRAPALGRLSDEDVARLQGLGLVEVIDLRYQAEIDIARPDRLPAGVPVTRVPIFDPDSESFRFVAAVMAGEAVGADEVVGPGVPHGHEPAAAMVGAYRWFVSGAPARAGFGLAVRHIAAARGRPVLYHCSAGKDRTGWLSVILLSALGVERDTITADYLRTNEDGGAVLEKMAEALARRRGLRPEAVRPLLVAAPEYLDAAYAEVKHRYGSIDGYLRDGLGLDDALLDGLREALLE